MMKIKIMLLALILIKFQPVYAEYTNIKYNCLASTQSKNILMLSASNHEPSQINDLMYFPYLKPITIERDSGLGVGGPDTIWYYSYNEKIDEKMTGKYDIAVRDRKKILFVIYSSPELLQPIYITITLNQQLKDQIN